MLKLSESQLIDCSHKNDGCNGGYEEFAFEYALKHPLMLERDYPYEDKVNECKFDEEKGKVNLVNYQRVTKNDRGQLRAQIAISPVTVALDASNVEFLHYSGGIMNSEGCGTSLNHSGTAVGFGEEDGHKYFIVKNSMGTLWGEEGYIRISAEAGGDGDGDGICGILKDAVRPITD